MALRFIGGNSVESHSLSVNIGLLFLRFATVCTLVYYELAIHLGKAWNNVWQDEVQWGLVDQFTDLNLPLPSPLAVTVILAAFLTAIGLLLGFLCRVNSLILIGIFGFLLLYQVKTSDNFTPEVIVVYLIIMATLFIVGAGRFSMDHILTSQRIRRKG